MKLFQPSQSSQTPNLIGPMKSMRKFSLQVVALTVFAVGLIWFSGEGEALQRRGDGTQFVAAETLRIDLDELQSQEKTVAPADGSRKYYQQIKKLTNAIADIRGRYMDTVDAEELVNAAIRGMLQDLDRYSVLMEKESYSNLMEATSGKYEGVGMQIDARNDYILIVSPLEGGPAEKLGLRAGDMILEIEGKSTHKMKTSDASSMMRGKAGTKVKVKVKREGLPDAMEFDVVRDVIALNSVNYAGRLPTPHQSVGYIRLSRFAATSVDELREALHKVDADNLSGLIFDLRSNGGGLLDQAVSIAELFVPKNSMIVYTQGKDPSSRKTYRSRLDPLFPSKPLVVLIDEGTASASEIVAGAIQDLDRGLALGQTTYGKGLVQQVIHFEDDPDVYLKLTTARYYTPSGRCIQRLDRQSKDDTFIEEFEANASDSAKDTLTLDQREKFFTQSGRVVHGGGGIVPDVAMDPEYWQPVTINLIRKTMFFDFASLWLAKNPNTDVRTFEVTDALTQEFRDYVKSKDFDYKTGLQVALGEFKKTVKEEKQGALFDNKVTEFESLVTQEKDNDFDEAVDEIKLGIRREIVSHLAGERGRYEEYVLKTDKTILRAVELLSSKKEYSKILSDGATASKTSKL